MIDRILSSLPKGYTRDSKTWVFLSWYTNERKLLLSQGMVTSQDPLESVLNSLWEKYFIPLEKKVETVAMDIVTDSIEIHDLTTLNQYDAKEFGFVMIDTDDDLSGVMLPNTLWITDTKHALRAMKQKYALHGKVEVIAFRTHRSILTK